MDPEQRPVVEKHFLNATVHTFAWSGVTVTVKNSKSGQPKILIDNAEGIVEAGECCAIMGPSGGGKTTLLNALAQRSIKAVQVEGQVLVNGAQLSNDIFRHVTSLVEDHDAFAGALSVRETLQFASRLAGIPRGNEAQVRIDTLLESFGLLEQANLRVGRGISKGQQRRLTVAKQLLTGPKVLFLDEPTSGLDSVASYKVVSYLRQLAKRSNLIIICSIHQPTTSIFNLFDKLLLLSTGNTHYLGAMSQLVEYYESIGVTIPHRANPADFLLELVNIDFLQDTAAADERVVELAACWKTSANCQRIHNAILSAERMPDLILDADSRAGLFAQLVTLSHRSFIKAYRDIMAYTFRLVMYAALGILVGTIWLQMDRSQDSIQLLVSALLVSCGFMSFMAMAYVPAFIEDYHQFCLDHRNGLYGAGRFLMSNFAVGTPYLFFFSLTFSVIFYWLGNCRHSANAFFTWVMWLYLDLLAAEGVVILSVTIIPSFVGALVITSLINLFAFAIGATLVPPAQLNAFYKYGFYYWNFQSYVFQGMMFTQFGGETYTCGAGCQCRYAPLPDQCHIAGETVLDQYRVRPHEQGRNVGIVIGIILAYRLAAWAVLKLKH